MNSTSQTPIHLNGNMIPDTYVNTNDSFYSNFAGGGLTGPLVSRGVA